MHPIFFKFLFSNFNKIPLLDIPKSPPTQKYAQPSAPLDHYYTMNHKKRGMALIFNHEIFEINSPRKGTNVDRDRLKDTMESLDFDVNIYTNQTISDIKQTLLDGEIPNYTFFCIDNIWNIYLEISF